MLADLGLELPADLDKLVGDKFGGNISRERMDLLELTAALDGKP